MVGKCVVHGDGDPPLLAVLTTAVPLTPKTVDTLAERWNRLRADNPNLPPLLVLPPGSTIEILRGAS